MIHPFESNEYCCYKCGVRMAAASETDDDGAFWTYCRECNEWTEHKPPTPDK